MESRAVPGVVIRELTIACIYTWLVELMAAQDLGEPDQSPQAVVDRLILEDMPLTDLARMTSLPVSEMGKLTPSTLQALARECQAVNSHFFRLARGIRTGIFPSLNDGVISAPPLSPLPAEDTLT